MRTKSHPELNSRLTGNTAVFRTTYNGMPEKRLGLILILVTAGLLLLAIGAAALILKLRASSSTPPTATEIRYTGKPSFQSLS